MTAWIVHVSLALFMACAVHAATPEVHHIKPPTNLASEVQQLKAMVKQLNVSLTQALLKSEWYLLTFAY